LKRVRKTRVARTIHSATGFTIIEVLIVLAIAAFILLIIFLAVPALHRNEHNYERKHFVDIAASELLEYKANKGKLPNTNAEGQDFIDNYLGGLPATLTFNFQDATGHHGYVPPLDTVVIEYAHWCNRYGNGDLPTDPIAGAGNDDMNLNFYAIWTRLEPDDDPSASDGASLPNQLIYCVDDR
jgi:prepilin-type N-terminal cleavage/methylation domain-containing protein